jgi:hypothetical protein
MNKLRALGFKPRRWMMFLALIGVALFACVPLLELGIIPPLPILGVECAHHVKVTAWLDENQNGVRDLQELPVQKVLFYLDDTRNELKKVATGVSDAQGEATLFAWLLGCSWVAFQLMAVAPADYEFTTPSQVRVRGTKDEGPFQFGLAYLLQATPTARPVGTLAQCTSVQSHLGSLRGGVVFASDGTAWVYNDDGVSHTILETDGGSQYGREEFGHTTSLFTGLGLGSDGEAWVASYGSGVFKFDGEQWQNYSAKDGLGADETGDVAVTPDGMVWVATAAGISQYDPTADRWMTYPGMEFLTGPALSHLLVAPDGNLWAVTTYTIHRTVRAPVVGEAPSWVVIKAGEEDKSVPLDQIRDVGLAPDGSLWVAGVGVEREAMVARLQPTTGTWTFYTYNTTKGAMAVDYVMGISIAPDGSIWVSTNKPVAFQLIPGDGTTPDRWLSYPTEFEDKGGKIGMVEIAPDGVLWFLREHDTLRCIPTR